MVRKVKEVVNPVDFRNPQEGEIQVAEEGQKLMEVKDETVIVESKDESNVEVKDDAMTVVIEPVESVLHKRMRERYEGMQRCDPRGWEANKDALLEKLSKIK